MILPIVSAVLLVLSGVDSAEPVVSYPVCDVSIDSTVCLHNGEVVLLPNARPYGIELHLDFDQVRPLDNSGEKNHAAGQSLAAAGVGGFGSSALFRKNYVLVPHSPGFMTADFSYTFYVYLLEDEASRVANELHDQYCPIVHKGVMTESAEEASPAILVKPGDGRIKVVVSTTATLPSAGEEMLSNSKLKPHQWYHIAVVRHLNRVKLFVDGILDSTFITDGATRTNDMPIYIGSAPYAENLCDLPLLLDELRVYSVAIGKDQIQAEASGALAGVEPSYIHVSCINCNTKEAEQGCPKGHHLCNKLELYTGGYQVARKLSLASSPEDVLSSDSGLNAKGVGICCADV